MNGLPDAYLAQMKDLLGDDYPAYLASLAEERRFGLRTNDGKMASEAFAALSPFSLTRIPWVPNGFFYDGKAERPARHPYYYAGLYYLQEPSAMTPAALLDVQPGERVLDLCAAPGGKSTQLGAALRGRGVLVTNDVSNSRAKALLKNIELFGIRNAVVTSDRPDRLAERFAGYFDKILIDAPCSGEGMFRKDAAVSKAWEEHGNAWYAALQKEIVTQAVPMLKPGGKLLYSTCTFSPLEDEGTVQEMLDAFPDLHVADLPRYEGFAPGMPERVPHGDPSLAKCVRIFPHRMPGEGHFIALLEKEGELAPNPPYEPAPDKSVLKDEPFAAFVKQYLPEGYLARLTRHGERILMRPDQPLALSGLRVMRGGWLIGESAKNRFEPSQAFAMGLRAEDFSRTVVLEPDGDEVIRYLKGETIPVPDGTSGKGYVLVCVRAGEEAFPLGFAKYNGAMLKNLYLSGWRWM